MIKTTLQKLNIMTHTNVDWTHTNIMIDDIRKLSKFYVISVFDPENVKTTKEINSPLYIKDVIFEDRLKSYFFKNIFEDTPEITKEQIMDVKWNMYITKGYYVKIADNGSIVKFDHYNDNEKWYVSYLEIAGPLGSFSSIYRDKELNKTEKNG